MSLIILFQFPHEACFIYFLKMIIERMKIKNSIQSRNVYATMFVLLQKLNVLRLQPYCVLKLICVCV